MNVKKIKAYSQKTIDEKNRKYIFKVNIIGNLLIKSHVKKYKSLLYFNFKNILHNSLEQATLNLYLGELYQCTKLDMCIVIKKYYEHDRFMEEEFANSIFKKDIGRYITIDLNNFLNKIDLNICKEICLELYTNNKNGVAIIDSIYGCKYPFIELKYRTDSQSIIVKEQEPKAKVVKKHSLSGQEELGLQEFREEERTNSVQNTKDELLHLKEMQSIKSESINYYSSQGMKAVLCKLIGEYINIEIYDNCIKTLKGVVNSINGYNLILKEEDYFHFISIESITTLYVEKDIEIENISDDKIYNDFKLGIKDILCYLKKKLITLSLNNQYMNAGNVEIVAVGNGIVKVKEINVKKPKIYILNCCYIKVIERIPLDDNMEI